VRRVVWYNPLSWFQAAEAEHAALAAGPVDFSEFLRTSWGSNLLTANDLITLGSVGLGCTPNTPPSHVHAAVIDAMGFHPMIYMGESMVTAPATDPELYFLRGDPKIVAECEAWLRPLLVGQRAPILGSIARGFGLGSVPIVLDYGEKALSIKVPAKSGEGERNKNLPGHVHFVASHEVWPGDAQLRVQGDRLLGLVAGGVEYGGEDLEPGRARAFLALWDPKPGADRSEFWQGQGSRRRAYRDWIEEGGARLWEIRAIERGVDLPRVGYAPEGKLKIGGQEIDAIKLLRAQIMALRNGSAIVLPNTLLADNSPAFKVDVLKATVQHQLLEYAIDSRGKRMLLASLTPASLDKATEEQFMDSVQRVCDFTARTLTRIVNTVVRLNHGEGAPFVQVVANDIPKRKQRVALEVFKTVAGAVQHLPDGKVVTVGELVDGPEILKQIGIMDRPMDEAAHKQAGPPSPPAGPPGLPGRPRDAAGGREERRDSAITVDGESDTGGKDVERDSRGEMRAAISAMAHVTDAMASVAGGLHALASAETPPPQPPPIHVHVEPTPVHVDVAAPSVTLEQPAPVLLPPVVVPAPVVNNTITSPDKKVIVEFSRDGQGRLSGATGDEIAKGGA
jgi:hypothetical protein